LPGQHSRSRAWKSATEPLYKIVNPRAVFDRLTAGGVSGEPTAADEAAAQARRARDQSVLDFVLEDTDGLQRKLGASDRRKLDQFLTSVRGLEQRVAEPSMQLSGLA